MFHRGLSHELWWFSIFLVLMGTIGFSLGYLRESLILAMGCYIAWLHVHLNRIAQWLAKARHSSPKENTFSGIWAELIDSILLLWRRYEKDKVRLQAVVTRVQEMTSTLNDAIILLNSRNNIEWWNKSAERIFDFRDMDYGHKITNIIRNPKFLSYFDEQDYREPLDLNSARHTGKRLQYQIHPFGKGERLIIVRDITRVHKLERMRRDFVANVSHELRTPLTVIRGYVDTLALAPELSGKWQKAIGQMQAQGVRMTALINDLISLANLETDERENLDEVVHIEPLFQMVINDAQVVSADKSHQFSAHCPPHLSMLGSEKELRSAFSNLVINAVKYSPKGTKICLDAEIEDNQLIFHVKDQGLGIDPKHIPRLTERFYRVDEGRSSNSGGTGLGLAIVKHVLIRHDATLRISSQLGKGSVFSCYFPIKRVSHEKISA